MNRLNEPNERAAGTPAPARRPGYGLILIGIACLLASACFLAFNLWLDFHGGQASAAIVEAAPLQLREAISAPLKEPEELPARPDDDWPLPVVEVDGEACVGLLSIPAIDLTLPVLADFNQVGQRIAPGVYVGSPYRGDLILAGHNFRTHFGRLPELPLGAEAAFVDAAGNRFRYELVDFTVLGPYDVRELKGGSADWDLTLFTCTFDAINRYTCRFVETGFTPAEGLAVELPEIPDNPS